MHEILFRGKKISDGKWMEGDLLRSSVDGVTYSFIFMDDYTYNQETGEMRANFRALVEPATVGQYTGMEDKNGKRIFEGDVVRVSAGYAGPVVFGKYTQSKCDEYECEHHGWHIACEVRGWCADTGVELDGIECEVIGNLYDNPELLGGAANA